jgi:two-component system, NtrC family, response regulator AtoC
MTEKKVFVVDDDRLIQNFLEYALLGKGGYEVIVFTTAEECIINLDRKPDIIVLDHSFLGLEEPLMTGLEALEKIRTTNLSVPVIILSSIEDPELIRDYFAKGATEFIIKKGYFINHLFESIEKIIQKSEIGK